MYQGRLTVSKKTIKTSPSLRTSTPFKKVSPSECHTPPSSRKQLFDNCDHDINVINNLIDECSVLDISDCQDNSGLNAFRYAGTLKSSDVPSNRESSNLDEELKKLIPSILNELEKARKGDLLQKFFSQVSCGKFPLNNRELQLWCDVVDWNENTDTRQMRYKIATIRPLVDKNQNPPACHYPPFVINI